MSTIRKSLEKAVAANQLTEQEKAKHFAQPAEVLDVYYWLIGAPRPPFVSHNVERQAGEFLKRGYTLEDLEVTIRYIQRQIARANAGERNTGGFNPASLKWVKLMGEYGASNEMDDFNGKLSLARMAQQAGWKPTLHYATGGTETGSAGDKETKSAVEKLVNPEGRAQVSDEERERLAKQARELLGTLDTHF